MKYDGYSWIKVKKHKFDPNKSWEENYKDLERHHIDETSFLINKIREETDERICKIVKIKDNYVDIGIRSGDPIPMDSFPETLNYKWRVMRQDDNGVVYEVDFGLDKARAESKVKELEAKGHKQMYWMETV